MHAPVPALPGPKQEFRAADGCCPELFLLPGNLFGTRVLLQQIDQEAGIHDQGDTFRGRIRSSSFFAGFTDAAGSSRTAGSMVCKNSQTPFSSPSVTRRIPSD
jgi:hypothetical protein